MDNKAGTKKVRLGGKVSAEKIKVAEHESTGQMKEAFDAKRKAAEVVSHDQARHYL